jgi:creatinine amidohydrolase
MTSTISRDVPRLTSDDEEFRAKFRSWGIADLSYVDIREYLEVKDLVLVPMASTEQHGPHLPLYTDTITSRRDRRPGLRAHRRAAHPAALGGYSPQHMHNPAGPRHHHLRASTLLNLMYDVARSLIHHGFNRIIFVNGHGSNIKVIDPVLRRLRYETGALIGFVKPYMERYTGILERADGEPARGDARLARQRAGDVPGHGLGTRTWCAGSRLHTRARSPSSSPTTFARRTACPDVEFEGYQYFNFPMDHHEFIESGVIGNPMRATKEKGEEAFRRYSEHVARGILELMSVPVTVHDREFIDRVM